VHEAEPTPEDPEADPDDEHVVAVLTRAGYDVHPTMRAPFKAVSEDSDRRGRMHMLTGHSAFDRSAEKRARIMSSLGEVTRTRSIYFTEERTKRESVERTAIVSCEELAAMDDPDEVRDLLRERTQEPAES
jgi:putative transcriptional regulator